MPRRLVPQVPTLAALAAALDGTGPALLTDPSPRVVAALRPELGVPDDVAVVVPTSGSTGEPKGVLLTADALLASAHAALARLGGPGRWLLAVPPTHVGGLQVLVRSLVAGLDPLVLPPGPFTAETYLDATGGAAYASLVPTQLHRLVASGRDLTGPTVLLGGAAAPAPLLGVARGLGARVVTTYGMSETSGGCVYDGVPLDGVTVGLDDGVVLLDGPVLARGYLHRPDLTAAAFGPGGFRTGDLGRLVDGRLQVLGRADDVINTGGEKVAPAAVEAALLEHPAVAEAAVVGEPDEEWGQRVVAVVVLRAPLALEQARAHVAARLPTACAPRTLRVVDALPLLPSGKIDRVQLRQTP